jgi:acyl-CoA reductase-like NAD-dependent aldehyde dehydrogenase
MEKILNYINGVLTEPVNGIFFNNINPAEGKPYSLVPDSDAEDVAKATAAAQHAFAKWSTSAKDRSAILIKIAELIERDLDKLALAESIDQGKPVNLAKSLDIPRAAANIGFMLRLSYMKVQQPILPITKLSTTHNILPLVWWVVSRPGTYRCICLPGKLRPRLLRVVRW